MYKVFTPIFCSQHLIFSAVNSEPLRYFQEDTKDRVDVPYYVERLWKARFPRYLFQARDVGTGALYSAYAYERRPTTGCCL